MQPWLILTATLLSGVAALQPAQAHIRLKDGFYSYTELNQDGHVFKGPLCSPKHEAMEIAGESAKLYALEGCSYTPFKKIDRGFTFSQNCKKVGGIERTFRIEPTTDSEFVATWHDEVSGHQKARMKRCDYDYATVKSNPPAQVVEARKQFEDERQADWERRGKYEVAKNLEVGEPGHMRPDARRDYENRQKPQAEVAKAQPVPVKCDAIGKMGVSEAFAQERIRWNPFGSKIFGNEFVQEVMLKGQGSRENPAEKADRYSTETIGNLVCALATRNVQVSFETSWFSSTPNRMVLTAATGRKNKITADLAAANDGPDNAPRWRLTAMELAGTRKELPKDDPGLLVKCLLSSTEEEQVGGFLIQTF
jgi:hypothetical protein